MSQESVSTIAILSCADDLHALAVERRLSDQFGVTCGVVEVDTLAASSPGLTWSTCSSFSPALPTRDGRTLAIPELDAIWYRRAYMPQRAAKDLAEPAYIDVVDHSCTTTLLGSLATHFRGQWISDPDASRNAENKLVQLDIARRAGLRVPRTLISQDPAAIKEFCDELDGNVIMKPLRGARDRHLLTLRVNDDVHLNPSSLRLCPTIFQEYVPGCRHLRVLACGSTMMAFAIETEELDWRPNLDVPVSLVELDAEISTGLARVLSMLNLRMGIFDLKVGDKGPVWLEVNPQGQFLFLEGITGVDLTTVFAEFLAESAAKR